jgi:hypothetical protein
MEKMTTYAHAALEILKQGGFMRSEKQPDGSNLIRLYNADGERLNGHYNAVQIVLDGRGLLNGTIVPEGDRHVCEWTYWEQSQDWDFDPRPARDTSIYA